MKAFKTIRFLLFTLLLIVIVGSCKKDFSNIGLQLLSEQDMLKIGYTDTVKLIAYSLKEDSLVTSGSNYALVGSMYDTVFGRTTADFYSDVLTTSLKARFGTAPKFDSAFLYLPYYGAYGDTNTMVNLKVYKLAENIYDSVHIYSYQKANYDPSKLLGSISFLPRPHDSVKFEGTKMPATIRINISNIFGNDVLNADTTSLNNAANFKKYFKGLCIVSEPQTERGKGSIVSFNLTNSRLIMYYRNSDDTIKHSYQFSVLNGLRFNHYEHYGYAEATQDLKNQLAGNHSNYKNLYIQGLAGVKVRVQLPDIKKWDLASKKLVLNNAELVIKDASPDKLFSYPKKLMLRTVGENGNTSPFPIIDENDAAVFDGNYLAGTYRFRITQWIQQVLTGKAENKNGFYILIPSSNLNPSRLVSNGPNASALQMKLYLRFTPVQ